MRVTKGQDEPKRADPPADPGSYAEGETVIVNQDRPKQADPPSYPGSYAEGEVVIVNVEDEPPVCSPTYDAIQSNNNDSTVTKPTNMIVAPAPIIDVSGPKKGHMFCGCCCDVRRATIAVNGVTLAFLVIYILSVSAAISNAESSGSYYYTDDQLQSALNAVIIVSVIGMVFCIIAIVGAAKFNPWLVLPNIIWLVIGFIANVAVSINACNTNSSYSPVGTIIVNLLFTGFFIYPQVVLFYELKISKTMSRPTYRREEHSCCCVRV